MTTTLSFSYPPQVELPFPVAAHEPADEVRDGVHLALFSVQPIRRMSERRLESRYPYPYPVHLTPVDILGQPILDDTLIVLGKHLSDHGIDFYHREPFSHRRVIASLPVGDRGWIAFLLELTWTRFSRHGWYDNGGKFKATVNPPLRPRS